MIFLLYLATIATLVLALNYIRNPEKRNPFKAPSNSGRWRWKWLPYRTSDCGWKMLCWVRKPRGYNGFFG